MISVAFAVRRMVRGAPQNPAEACPGRCAARASSGAGSRVHQHDRPCGRTALPDLRHAPAAAAGYLRGHGRDLFALVNWIKVPPYMALGQFTAENLATAAALFPVAIASTWAGVLARAAGLGPALLHGRLRAAGPRRRIKLVYRRRGRASCLDRASKKPPPRM